jgi:hypothetical protein
MLYWVHLVWAGFKLTTLVVIGTDCIGIVIKLTTIRSRPPNNPRRLWYHDHPIIQEDYDTSWWCWWYLIKSISRRGALNTTLCDKVCQWLTTGQWFSPGTSVSSTNKTDRHDITEILLKVTLNTITINRSYSTNIQFVLIYDFILNLYFTGVIYMYIENIATCF